MALIYNTIDKVNCDPQQLSILVEILWDKDTQLAPVHTDEEKMCDGPVRLSANSSGYWEIEVQPNDLIFPDSVYRITHYRDDTGVPQLQYYISVPDGASPSYWVGDLLVTEPAWFNGSDWGGANDVFTI